tara:strand:+ start:1328 stop:1846 length:519 start_codon:yes stop_codon:yes gene_type:complete
MNKDKFWLNIIYILSAVLSIAVAFLILGPRPEGVEGSIDISYLPFTNATLNFITTILLLVGYFFIRQKKREKHRLAMLSAFFSSALFLISYIIYHWFKSGPKLYNGDWELTYYFILITHIILATIILPLAMITLYRGWVLDIQKHRTIARITFPIWMYVSITGIIIYIMLYI